MRGIGVLLATAGLTAGCAITAPWPDRDWVDAGCGSPGPCAVRGRLQIAPGGSGAQSRLMLEGGDCLAIVLPSRIVSDRNRWNGRRVAVRGRAVPFEMVIETPERCSPGSLVLHAHRLSLKGER